MPSSWPENVYVSTWFSPTVVWPRYASWSPNVTLHPTAFFLPHGETPAIQWHVCIWNSNSWYRNLQTRYFNMPITILCISNAAKLAKPMNFAFWLKFYVWKFLMEWVKGDYVCICAPNPPNFYNISLVFASNLMMYFWCYRIAYHMLTYSTLEPHCYLSYAYVTQYALDGRWKHENLVMRDKLVLGYVTNSYLEWMYIQFPNFLAGALVCMALYMCIIY